MESNRLQVLLLGLKAALFEMKDAIISQKVGPSEETFIQELERKNSIQRSSLLCYFNCLMMIAMKAGAF